MAFYLRPVAAKDRAPLGRFLFCRRKTAHVQNQRTEPAKRFDFPVMHLAETLRRIVLLGRELFFRCQLRSVRSVLKS